MAEEACADYLHIVGYDILKRNVRVGRLEVDLIASKGGTVCVVEVRARSDSAYAGPLASVGAAKRKRLLSAAESLWRSELKNLPGIERIRIDVAGVTVRERAVYLEYIEGALVGGFGLSRY